MANVTASSASSWVVHQTPSRTIPWSIQHNGGGNSLIPPKTDFVKGCLHKEWGAAVTANGHVWVWHAAANKVAHLFFPSLKGDDLLIQLQEEASGNSLWLANAKTGWIGMRKISIQDLEPATDFKKILPLVATTAHTRTTQIRLPLQANERLSCLSKVQGNTNSWTVGTSFGRLFWMTPTVIPATLQLTPLTTEKASSSSSWTKWFSSSSSASSGPPPQDPVVHVASLPSQNDFLLLLVGKSGWVTHWRVSETNKGRPSPPPPVVLGPLLRTRTSGNVLAATLLKSPLQLSAIGLTDKHQLVWMQASLEISVDGKDITWKNEPPTILSRFDDPSQVRVVGMNGAYALMQQTDSPLVVLALHSQQLWEWDELQRSGDAEETDTSTDLLSLGDVVAFDADDKVCHVVSTQGHKWKIQCVVLYESEESGGDELPEAKRMRIQHDGTNVATLVGHLRSTFWRAYPDFGNEDKDVPVVRFPPSLRQEAATGILEQVVLVFARDLQAEAAPASALPWHVTLIQMLQQQGLFTHISQSARQKLLQIGQEAAIRKATMDLMETTPEIRRMSIGRWLLRASTQHGEDTFGQPEWQNFLCTCIEAAEEFRSSQAGPLYDLYFLDQEKVPALWLSNLEVQQVLVNQVDWYRQQLAAASTSQNIESIVVVFPPPTLETWMPTIMQACAESLASGGKNRQCCQTIGLLRKVAAASPTGAQKLQLEKLAWQLSVRFKNFGGLCLMAREYQDAADNSFQLEALLASSTQASAKEPDTGYTLSQYILQWHTDRGMYGHVLNYGRFSSAAPDLRVLLEKDQRLRPYRWIASIRAGNYGQATDCLLGGPQEARKTVKEAKWALSMAKLTSRMDRKRGESLEKDIDNQLELLVAQELIIDAEDDDKANANDAFPWSRTQVIERSLALLQSKVQQLHAPWDDIVVEVAVTCLAVCASCGDAKSAAQVWAICWQADAAQWHQFRSMTMQNPKAVRQRAMQTTLFGLLLQECRRDQDDDLRGQNSLSSVTYARHLEPAVIENLLSHGPDEDEAELLRLLRTVSARPGRGEVLASGSF